MQRNLSGLANLCLTQKHAVWSGPKQNKRCGFFYCWISAFLCRFHCPLECVRLCHVSGSIRNDYPCLMLDRDASEGAGLEDHRGDGFQLQDTEGAYRQGRRITAPLAVICTGYVCLMQAKITEAEHNMLHTFSAKCRSV